MQHKKENYIKEEPMETDDEEEEYEKRCVYV